MFHSIVYYFFYSGLLIHIFCCGVPLVMGAISIGAMLGIAGGDVMEFEWFERNEGIVSKGKIGCFD